MKVIPAIDILNGRVVRLFKGDYNQVTDYGDVLDVAASFANAGVQYLHIVDLSGAEDPSNRQIELIQKVSEIVPLIQVGGGLRNPESIRSLLDQGIERVVIGSYAVSNAKEIIDLVSIYGPERFVIAADFLNGTIRTHGWKKDSGIPVHSFIATFYVNGIRRFLCTDINNDGALQGVNIAAYQLLQAEFPFIEIIASGGVSSADDFKIISEARIPYCVVGRAYYEGIISLDQIKEYA